MVEKRLSLQFSQEDVAVWAIPQDIVYEIMRYIPTTINDDFQERKEEVRSSEIGYLVLSLISPFVFP